MASVEIGSNQMSTLQTEFDGPTQSHTLVKNFMHQNINIKKMLKDHRLEAEHKVDKKDDPVQTKEKPAKGKKDAKDKQMVTEEASKEITTEKDAAPVQLTDDEVDSVITDEDLQPNFTRNQACLRKDPFKNILGPNSILSAKRTASMERHDMAAQKARDSNLPDHSSGEKKKQYKASTKGKFLNNVAQPPNENFSRDKKWLYQANPQAAQIEKNYYAKDREMMERRRYQKVIQQVNLEDQIGIQVTRIPDVFKDKIVSKNKERK